MKVVLQPAVSILKFLIQMYKEVNNINLSIEDYE